MNDAILAEQAAWNVYRSYCVRRTPNGQTEFFKGDAASALLWEHWHAAYLARRMAAKTFYRRTNSIRFGSAG